MPAFDVPDASGSPLSCAVALVLSISSIGGQQSCRQLLLLGNGNLMASSFQVNAQRLRRKYFRLSFPQHPSLPEYRGPAAASSANSDLFRLLSHFSEQLLHMRCSPLPQSIEELERNVSTSYSVVHDLFSSSLAHSPDEAWRFKTHGAVAE
jgi:hypothetical protein